MAAPAPPAADWAGLPHDLLVVIAKRVKVIEDFIAFGGVCTSWRMASTKDNFDVLSPQLPLLMLSNDHTDDDYREFYSLSKGKVTRRLYLPETKRRDCFPFHQMGWILTQSTDGLEVNLLNPFSSTKIQLPDQFALMALQGPDDDNSYDPGVYNNINKACLSANPSFTSDYVLVVSYNTDVNYLAYWIPGDINWTEIHLANRFGAVCNMVYYKALFYLITWGAEIWIVDVQRPQRRVESRLIYLSDYLDLLQQHSTQYYLVEEEQVSIVLNGDDIGRCHKVFSPLETYLVSGAKVRSCALTQYEPTGLNELSIDTQLLSLLYKVMVKRHCYQL